MDQTKQAPVGMSEGPHQPARFVGDIQIHPNLKSVKQFKDEPERQEDEQRPPAEAEMPPSEVGRGVSIVRHCNNQGPQGKGISFVTRRGLFSEKQRPGIALTEEALHHVHPEGTLGVEEELWIAAFAGKVALMPGLDHGQRGGNPIVAVG